MKTVIEIFTVFRIQDNLVESFDSFSTLEKAVKHFTTIAKYYYNLPDEKLTKYAKKRILLDKQGNSVQIVSHYIRK